MNKILILITKASVTFALATFNAALDILQVMGVVEDESFIFTLYRRLLVVARGIVVRFGASASPNLNLLRGSALLFLSGVLLRHHALPFLEVPLLII